jgi:hypothetical protein
VGMRLTCNRRLISDSLLKTGTGLVVAPLYDMFTGPTVACCYEAYL